VEERRIEKLLGERFENEAAGESRGRPSVLRGARESAEGWKGRVEGIFAEIGQWASEGALVQQIGRC
jgi:hypothetical protein